MLQNAALKGSFYVGSFHVSRSLLPKLLYNGPLMKLAHGHDIIVIGASAGGVEALKEVAASLPADLPAAVFAVLHQSPDAPGMLGKILDRSGPLPAGLASDGEAVEHGRIYVAPPDHHLLVKEGQVVLGRGPRENRSRPAIDPTFRSAAVAYGSRVVGVILTGYLDDGASGLAAVERCGGVTVVQDPEDAAYPDMPESALRAVAPGNGPDHIVPLAEVGALLSRLAHTEPGEAVAPPQDIAIEARIAERAMSDIPAEEAMGDQVPVGCPDCGGPLWEVKEDRVKRFRCHVGHAYTERALVADQDDAVERALWAALRTLEERANMLESMARREHDAGRSASGRTYDERAAESREHVAHLRELLLDSPPVSNAA